MNGLPPLSNSGTQTIGGTQGVGIWVDQNGTLVYALKAANGAANTTGNGLLGVGNLIWDGTNWQRWKNVDNSGGAITTSGLPAVAINLVNGANAFTTWATAATQNTEAATGNNIGTAALHLYNLTGTVDRLKQANNASNTTGIGLLGAGTMGWDGTNWQRIQTASQNDAITLNGSALATISQLYLYNGTNYDRGRSATAANSTSGTGLLGIGHLAWNSSANQYKRIGAATSTGDGTGDFSGDAGLDVYSIIRGFNGSTFDRVRVSTDGTSLTGAVRTIPVASTFSNITTNTTTTVKASAGVITGLVVNTAGTTSTVILKDNATVIGTFTTTAQGSLPFASPIACATSIVAVTAGAAAADITVLYR